MELDIENEKNNLYVILSVSWASLSDIDITSERYR